MHVGDSFFASLSHSRSVNTGRSLLTNCSFGVPNIPGTPSWATIPAAKDTKMTHWICRLKKCVNKSNIPSRNMENSGLSEETIVVTTVSALMSAGLPSRGAKSSLNAINIFSLIFFFIFLYLLYFKWVSTLYTHLRSVCFGLL